LVRYSFEKEVEMVKREPEIPESDAVAEGPIAIPFSDAEEAWFWYCKYEERSVFRSSNSNRETPRPCQLDDIYICVVRLALDGKISRRHVATLVKYGRKQRPPDFRVKDEEMESMWWDDALDKLQSVLARKGIVSAEA
jgi:hypothetical protein